MLPGSWSKQTWHIHQVCGARRSSSRRPEAAGRRPAAFGGWTFAGWHQPGAGCGVPGAHRARCHAGGRQARSRAARTGHIA